VSIPGTLLAFCSACGASPSPPPPSVVSSGELAVVAEGPCAKLAPYPLGNDVVVVFGDTGYELSDWDAGEPWAAAQSLVLLRDGVWGTARSLLAGLPRDDRGFVPFDLRVGEDSRGAPWLRLTDTAYAERGTGQLLVRKHLDYAWSEGAWQLDEGAIDLGSATRVPEIGPCEDPELRFVPLDFDTTPDGAVFVAGRCQDEFGGAQSAGGEPSPPKKTIFAYEDTELVVAVSMRGDGFSYARLPRSQHLSGMVNVDVEAESATRAWVVAYEPFAAPPDRKSYLAAWDGARFSERDLGVDRGLMSVARVGERLYLAASDALFSLDDAGSVRNVPLPPVRLAEPAPALHIHTVTALHGALWVQASYRVLESRGPSGEKLPRDASVLFSTAAAREPLLCDAREPAERAVAAWAGRP
jgi:hypothetical protein